jgi:hypothetical protein
MLRRDFLSLAAGAPALASTTPHRRPPAVLELPFPWNSPDIAAMGWIGAGHRLREAAMAGTMPSQWDLIDAAAALADYAEVWETARFWKPCRLHGTLPPADRPASGILVLTTPYMRARCGGCPRAEDCPDWCVGRCGPRPSEGGGVIR